MPDRFVPQAWAANVVPNDWPQDKAQVPQGFGLMPRVDFQNKYTTKQEAFTYVYQLRDAPVGVREEIVPTQPDGDFWCSQIICRAYSSNDGTNFFPNSAVGFKVQITDIRTGKTLFDPYSRVCTLMQQLSSLPAGGTTQGILIQPFVFTRNGGIKVNLVDDTAYSTIYNPNVYLFLSFNGWKEYLYASS